MSKPAQPKVNGRHILFSAKKITKANIKSALVTSIKFLLSVSYIGHIKHFAHRAAVMYAADSFRKFISNCKIFDFV